MLPACVFIANREGSHDTRSGIPVGIIRSLCVDSLGRLRRFDAILPWRINDIGMAPRSYPLVYRANGDCVGVPRNSGTSLVSRG